MMSEKPKMELTTDGDTLTLKTDSSDELQVSEWISVEDRLPEDEKLVLCWQEYMAEYQLANIVISDGGNRKRWYYDRCEFFYGKDGISHWMPLPEPPK